MCLKFAVLLYPTPYGALTQLFTGTMPEALNYNGEVCTEFVPRHSHLALTFSPSANAPTYHRFDVVPYPVGASGEMQTRDVRRRGRCEAVGLAGG